MGSSGTNRDAAQQPNGEVAQQALCDLDSDPSAQSTAASVVERAREPCSVCTEPPTGLACACATIGPTAKRPIKAMIAASTPARKIPIFMQEPSTQIDGPELRHIK